MSNKENIAKAKIVAGKINTIQQMLKSFSDFAAQTVHNDDEYSIYFGANKINKKVDLPVDTTPQQQHDAMLGQDVPIAFIGGSFGNKSMSISSLPPQLQQLFGGGIGKMMPIGEVYRQPAIEKKDDGEFDIAVDLSINGGDMLQMAIVVKKIFTSKLIALKKEYKQLTKGISKADLVEDMLNTTTENE